VKASLAGRDAILAGAGWAGNTLGPKTALKVDSRRLFVGKHLKQFEGADCRAAHREILFLGPTSPYLRTTFELLAGSLGPDSLVKLPASPSAISSSRSDAAFTVGAYMLTPIGLRFFISTKIEWTISDIWVHVNWLQSSMNGLFPARGRAESNKSDEIQTDRFRKMRPRVVSPKSAALLRFKPVRTIGAVRFSPGITGFVVLCACRFHCVSLHAFKVVDSLTEVKDYFRKSCGQGSKRHNSPSFASFVT
jgi:hypothetical protein